MGVPSESNAFPKDAEVGIALRDGKLFLSARQAEGMEILRRFHDHPACSGIVEVKTKGRECVFLTLDLGLEP